MKRQIIKSTTLIALLSFTPLMAETINNDEAKALYAQESGEVNIPVATAAKAKFAGWYMRTTVKATTADGKVYEHNTAGVFGKLKQSRYKQDMHDIPSYGPAALQVVFPKSDWGEANGDYFSDYRRWTRSKSNKRVVYTFQIKNQNTVDLSHADIEITLVGQQNVAFTKKNGVVTYVEKKFKQGKRAAYSLVDVDNQKVYKFGQIKNANLNMDGKHTRTFRWVRKEVKPRDLKPLAPAQTSQMTAMAAPEFIPAVTSAGKFGLPPQ